MQVTLPCELSVDSVNITFKFGVPQAELRGHLSLANMATQDRDPLVSVHFPVPPDICKWLVTELERIGAKIIAREKFL